MAWQLKQLNVAEVFSVTLLTYELQVSASHQDLLESTIKFLDIVQ
jgi:hypothetical protein